VIARTKQGDVRGIERDGVWAYRGIPYAAPPTGALRFRPPAPPHDWNGLRDATRFGPMAPQGVGPLEAMLGATRFPQSEDCLSLNVATPSADDGGRPVLVWIHGGGFQTGSGSIPWYHGTTLARRADVVVVSINYRLGALGFSQLAGTSVGDDRPGSGNLGLLDQVAALQWVQDNIENFGGDPGNVTIFGESAGGMSVGVLLGMPAARGLFHRAIAQSGACQGLASAEDAAATAERLIAEVGGPDALLRAPAEDVVAAQSRVAKSVRFSLGTGQILPFTPVLDGDVFPVHPLDAVRGGSAADVDLIAGTNAHEFTLFTVAAGVTDTTDERLGRAVQRVAGDRTADVLAAYRAMEPAASPFDLLVSMSTDVVFRLPCEELLAAHADGAGGATTRSYLFTFESPAFEGRLRSTHALEIPFVFGIVDRPGTELFVGEVDDMVRALGDACADAWTSFATDGTPRAGGMPAWQTWDAGARSTMELGTSRQVLHDPSATARAAWGR
jgi:para-nitrobenzyl esterase